MDNTSPVLVYDDTLPYNHPHNQAYARQKGWTLDTDWRMYRDHNNLLVGEDGTPPQHPVHLMR